MCHSDLLLFMFLENSLLEKVSFHFTQMLFKLYLFFFFHEEALFVLPAAFKTEFQEKKSFRMSGGSEFFRIFISILSRKSRAPHLRFRLLAGQVL